VAPTHREICDHFGFSSYGTVYKHLAPAEKGLIRRDWNQKRGVELVEQAAVNGEKQDRQPHREARASAVRLHRRRPPLDVEISNETITVPGA